MPKYYVWYDFYPSDMLDPERMIMSGWVKVAKNETKFETWGIRIKYEKH